MKFVKIMALIFLNCESTCDSTDVPASIYDNWEVIIFHCTDLSRSFGRGGSPLQNLIIRGIKDTKISAIRCVKEIDAGDVYMQKHLHIGTGTADEIYDLADKIIREDMIPYILEMRPEPKPQVGKPVMEWFTLCIS